MSRLLSAIFIARLVIVFALVSFRSQKLSDRETPRVLRDLGQSMTPSIVDEESELERDSYHFQCSLGVFSGKSDQ